MLIIIKRRVNDLQYIAFSCSMMCHCIFVFRRFEGAYCLRLEDLEQAHTARAPGRHSG